MRERTLFVAGASGAVGKTVVRLADGLSILPHYRRAPQPPIANAQVFSLDDRAQLVAALRGATTVAQLIGTMRKRFAKGDTYETSDIGTTTSLIEAAKEAGTIDHIILLSSVGAGGIGAYLKAKARAETLVVESGIPYTILRPSAFDGSEDRKAPPGLGFVTRVLGLAKYKPIRVDDLARAIVHIAATKEPATVVLEGDSLFAAVARANAVTGPSAQG